MQDIEQIELSVEQAKDLVKKRDMALKLASNREFKKLISEHYFVDEAARLVSLLAENEVRQHRDDIQDAMKGISYLRQFLRDTIRLGDTAANELREYEEELEELRSEDGDED